MDSLKMASDMQQFAVRWTMAQPTVTAFISSIFPRHQDREELLQRTAVSLVTLFPKYNPEQSFSAWAVGVARVEILRFRAERRRERAVFDTETVEAIAAAINHTESESREYSRLLEECLKKLTRTIRHIFELHYVRDIRPGEIAALLGRSDQSVFLSLHRARGTLRTCLERAFRREGVTR